MSSALIVPVAPMTRSEFLAIFATLAAQVAPQTDQTIALAYFEALQTEPIAAVKAAAVRLARESGRRFLPTTGEWLEAIRLVQREAVQGAAHQARQEPWRLECDRCEDTGWEMGLTCDGGSAEWPERAEKRYHSRVDSHSRKVGHTEQPRATETPRVATCGKHTPHLPHTYTQPCTCRGSNRTYQRKSALWRKLGGGAA